MPIACPICFSMRCTSPTRWRTASTADAGPARGETFWQFRQFQASDPATVIDWRRSASSDHLYVREREWEAAHTFWLWPDISPVHGLPQPSGTHHQARPRAWC